MLCKQNRPRTWLLSIRPNTYAWLRGSLISGSLICGLLIRGRLMRGLLFCLAVLCQISMPAQAADIERDLRDLITERAWLDDPSNSLGPEEVLNGHWTPYSGPLRRGFKTSSTWLRLRIEPPKPGISQGTDREARLVLRILPGQLDEIALFDPRRNGLPPLIAGDLTDWRSGEYRSFNQNLVIDSPAEPIEVLLRLRTTSHHGIHVEALRWEDVEAIDRQQHLVIGCVMIFLTMVLGWAIVAWIDRPDPVLAAFAIHQVFSILFTLAILGFFRVYLSDFLTPETISNLTSSTVPITTAAVLWFHWSLLREFHAPAAGLRILRLLALITPLNLLLMLADRMSLALQISLTVTLLTPLLLLILAIFSKRNTPEEIPRVPRSQLIVAYSLMLIILWNATLPAFGWLPSPPWAMYSAIAYGVISAMLLMGILRARARHLESARRAAQIQLALTEQAVRQERERRIEQDQFMTMLTHELTNSLATAHLAIGGLDPESPMRARGYRAIAGMRDIIHHCALSAEVEAGSTTPSHAPENVAALIREWCQQHKEGAEIRFTDEHAPEICNTDRQLLSVVVGNLIENALKYRAEGTEVEVSVAPHPQGARDGLQITVSNRIGEAGAPDPDKVFTKYWRGPGAARLAGSGLGLYLSFLIAGRLGGDLRYGLDTPYVRFVLWLPV
jgi:signal transduction histidine kinase